MSAVEVMRLAGVAMVQDGGRPGWMHMGVPPGGGLVPELLGRANLAVGNAAGAAGLEFAGSIVVAARGGGVVLATEDGETRALGDGESWSIEGKRNLRVRYLAVRGALDVPLVLGGRGTFLAAGFGGFEGRTLRKGDVLHSGTAADDEPGNEFHGPAPLPAWTADEGDPIRVNAGPDTHLFATSALRALESSPYVVQIASDRTGTRLSGPRLERCGADTGVSAPMVAGAIQVPASGDAIVLGPDHPTTGGYPVLAVVLRADLGRFHARPLGSRVTFRVR
jgi:biotin-dependent carboxylase-like uncharacterized protein